MKIEKGDFATVLFPDTQTDIDILNSLWKSIPETDKSYDLKDRKTFFRRDENDIAILIDHGI